MRVNELEKDVVASPQVIDVYATLAEHGSNTDRAIMALGLEGHPRVLGSTTRRKDRDPVRADVIYHADACSLYAHAPPSVTIKPDQDPPALLLFEVCVNDSSVRVLSD